MCAVDLQPWGGAILPHEDVMPGPVADRLALLRATRTHLSAIYGTVAGPLGDLRDLVDGACTVPAAQEVTDQEGVRHRTWPVPSEAPIDRWIDESICSSPTVTTDTRPRSPTARSVTRRTVPVPGTASSP